MTNTDDVLTNKQCIRNKMRDKRSSLSESALNTAAFELAEHAKSNERLSNAKKIASYLPSNGEISPIQLQNQSHAEFFLPRITDIKQSQMEFYPASNPLTCNRYQIWEPVAQGDSQSLEDVDIVLLPLVAFDRSGNRLGMGGGFYDRALSFKQQSSCAKPYLIGLAHHFQEVSQLPSERWDIPLDAILTDQQLITIRKIKN